MDPDFTSEIQGQGSGTANRQGCSSGNGTVLH
ncbi:MAG: Uncharacterised protein [Halieaceae bacterium]|nr:MAG: Uncharacterised protein [Halieaceae bacterium]